MINKKIINNNVRQDQPVRRLIGILLLLSILGIAGRLLFIGQQTLSAGDQIWRLSVLVSIVATEEEAALTIFPPIDTPNIRTVERTIFHPGFRISNLKNNGKTRRSIYAVSTDKGKQDISAEFFVHASQTPFNLAPTKNMLLNTQMRETYLLDTGNLQLNSFMVQETVKELLSLKPTKDELVNAIYNRIKTFAISSSQDQLNVPLVLAEKKATVLDQALSMVALSRASGIPARLVAGIILKEDIDPRLHYWVEIFNDMRWLSYDIHFGYKESVPVNYLPLRRNSIEIIEILKGTADKIDFELDQEFHHPYLKKVNNANIFSILDFNRLPLNVRDELALLLLLPFGALITALCRHLIGVHSYGVFTPTLLALAIVYNDFITTGIVFLVVCSLAVGGRSLFPETITRTPRLSIIFTLIAIMLAFSVSAMTHFDINQAGKIILLPVIILTSLVDNFYRTADDRGVVIAMRRLLWTIFITLLCLPVIQFESLGHLVLKYPEVHFVTLALFLFISKYKGNKLIDMPLLNLLAEPDKSDIKKKDARKVS